MATSFYPTTAPVKLAEIPSKETLLESMVPILEESKKWPLGSKYEEKGYGTTIQTFSRNKTARDHAMWHGRVSEHSKESIGGFEPFWDGLGHNHTLNEKEYFHELDEVKLIKKINDDQEIWSMHYILRPPVSNRTFTVLVTSHLEKDDSTGLRTGWVLTIPVDVTSDPELAAKEFHATKGAYSAVERIMELPDGDVNWRMVTTSTPGGLVPQWISERSMPAKIREDVPSYLGWLTKRLAASSP